MAGVPGTGVDASQTGPSLERGVEGSSMEMRDETLPLRLSLNIS
jgi:hypothetical protein